jgi:putative phosphoribosyl transferase
MPIRFKNREEAGRALAVRLMPLSGERPVVVGLARGGVPVAFEVSRALGAPLDVVVMRKLIVADAPDRPFGALAEGGGVCLDPEAVSLLGIPRDVIDAVAEREAAELQRTVERYRAGRPPIDVTGRTVIVVDDGVARGASVRAAMRSLRERSPRRIVLTAPVFAPDTAARLHGEADELVYLEALHHFGAVAFWYEDFQQVTEDEAIRLLSLAASQRMNCAGAEEEPQARCALKTAGESPSQA